MALSVRSLSELLLDLYQQASETTPDQFQPQALSRISESLHFDAAAWGGGWASDRQVTELSVLNEKNALIEDWMNFRHLDQFCDLTLHRLSTTFSFEDVADYRRTTVFNEHWRRFGVNHMIATIVAEPLDDYVSFIGLCRHQDSPAFDGRERQFKELLMPHLARNLQMNREHFLSSFDDSEAGLAWIDNYGVVKATRGRMPAIMRELWSQQRNIPEEIMRRLQQSGCWRNESYSLSARPVGNCWLAEAKPSMSIDSLTPRETEVANLYAQGHSHKEVARQLSIAPATVRNLLALVYRKLDVNDKAALCLHWQNATGRN